MKSENIYDEQDLFKRELGGINRERLVAYLGVSIVEQAEQGYSIDAQGSIIRQKCEQEGYELIAIYFDKGISGK